MSGWWAAVLVLPLRLALPFLRRGFLRGFQGRPSGSWAPWKLSLADALMSLLQAASGRAKLGNWPSCWNLASSSDRSIVQVSTLTLSPRAGTRLAAPDAGPRGWLAPVRPH